MEEMFQFIPPLTLFQSWLVKTDSNLSSRMLQQKKARSQGQHLLMLWVHEVLI